MPSARPYTALGLFCVAVVDFCFSSLKILLHVDISFGGKGLRGWERCCGGGRDGGESDFYPEKKGKRV